MHMHDWLSRIQNRRSHALKARVARGRGAGTHTGLRDGCPHTTVARAALTAVRGRASQVIGSGQKLAENRPLNEVLSARHGFGGPVLVAQGLNDRVSGPSRAQQRADLFERMRDGAGVTDDSPDAVTQAMLDWPVTVERIAGGHCVMDDSPDAVAQAMLEWLPDVRAYAAAATSGVLADTDSS
jgi:pimeloyl-ACP methyl ester carboxylesterase